MSSIGVLSIRGQWLKFRWPGINAKWDCVESQKKALVQVFLAERDGCVCHYCSESLITSYEYDRLTVPEQESNATPLAFIDHKTPKCKGGTNAPDNLVLSCRNCNSRKSTRDYYEYLLMLDAEEREVAA